MQNQPVVEVAVDPRNRRFINYIRGAHRRARWIEAVPDETVAQWAARELERPDEILDIWKLSEADLLKLKRELIALRA